MSLQEALLGRTAAQARCFLEENGLRFEFVEYASPRPDEAADEERVVRVHERPGGSIEVVTCMFRTQAENE